MNCTMSVTKVSKKKMDAAAPETQAPEQTPQSAAAKVSTPVAEGQNAVSPSKPAKSKKTDAPVTTPVSESKAVKAEETKAVSAKSSPAPAIQNAAANVNTGVANLDTPTKTAAPKLDAVKSASAKSDPTKPNVKKTDSAASTPVVLTDAQAKTSASEKSAPATAAAEKTTLPAKTAVPDKPVVTSEKTPAAVASTAVATPPAVQNSEANKEVQSSEVQSREVQNDDVQPDTETPPAEQAPGFRILGLSEPVMRAVLESGFEAPTPIQEQSIPILLAGRDLIGQAQTGTGKTAAFALPLAERLDPKLNYPQAIILLPTRELCIQVAQETHNLSKYQRLRIVPVYGGQPIDRQFRALAMGAHIVVGTPGRVLDHLRRGTLKLNQVRMVVLDEADEMLNMGFLEDVEEILKEAPKERQTALFSATMPPRIAALSRDYLNNPERVTIESKRRTVAQVDQTYYEVAPAQKIEALARILDMESPGSTIIFCRTRREVDELGEALQMRGYEAETLHGEMNQTARDRVMARFRASQADLLIATDVAARGLDIDQVTHVVNYDIPWDVESYIHRVGRTGRAGRSGSAITMISPRERRQLKLIERYINTPIRLARVPTSADITARRRGIFKENIKQVLTESDYDGFLMTVEELTSEGEFDASQIAAAALQMLWQAQKGAGDYDVAEANVESERVEVGMTRLFLQIGREDGIRPADIVGAIANEAGVSGSRIGAIDIMDRSTFVEVPDAEAPHVIEMLSQTKLRGKKVYVDIARPRREDGGQGGPGGYNGPRPDYGRPSRENGYRGAGESGGFRGGGDNGNFRGGGDGGGYRGNDRGNERGNDGGGRPAYGRDDRFPRPAHRPGPRPDAPPRPGSPRKKP